MLKRSGYRTLFDRYSIIQLENMNANIFYRCIYFKYRDQRTLPLRFLRDATLICYFFLMFFIPVSGAAVQERSIADEIQNRLRSQCEALSTESFRVNNDRIHASSALLIFYERRTFKSAWIDDKGFTPLVDQLIRTLGKADQEGLRPDDYHLPQIKNIMSNIGQSQRNSTPLNVSRLTDLDLLLTDAFLVYGAHLVKGKINPETIDTEWFANLREIDMPRVLEDAVTTRQITQSLLNLRPEHEGYSKLRAALDKYHQILWQTGWSSIPEGPSLKLGDSSPRISLIRKRLIATDDITSDAGVPDDFFDASLDAGVKFFQRRHGLDEDGIVGPATLKEMNINISDRIQQIEINMERWRWLPQDLGKCYIIVNIADFNLSVFDTGTEVLEMKAVVGKAYRRTPVFSDKMTYFVINPYWEIPYKIAVSDILTNIQKDPGYLNRKHIKVLTGWGRDTRIVCPETVNWGSLNAQSFSYRLRQDPGPWNLLGQIKFMLPNQFNVYIHDTPSRDLFAKSSRSFSSGCIRIEKPIDLAAYILSDNPKWTREEILRAIASGQEQTVALAKPVPVHILYWTAWVSADGIIHFRDDIYQRDVKLRKAMKL
jgi:murein L,D-transpeptidase YcbB/YkuD